MTATWDAWNRLVKLVDPDTSDTVAEFAYDGRNFRVVGKSFAGGTLDETRHYYFTDSWQCVEERIDSLTDPERQHVWGIRYIDDLVLRDRDTTGNGTLDERLYFLPDANWNVTAVVDDSGAVEERIEYTPYGQPQFLSPTFSSRTGSSFDVRYTYTSREWERAVGLFYFRNRWYVPDLGVFCSRDPIGYAGSKWNLWEYLSGSPGTRTDPFGFTSFDGSGCASAPPTSNTSGCSVHKGTIHLGFDAECVCRCAGSSPWDNQVRGCLDCAERAGVNPKEAHRRCYALADAEHGRNAGRVARLDIGFRCTYCLLKRCILMTGGSLVLVHRTFRT